MADNGIGDYFISDIDDELLEEDDELIGVPVVVPAVPVQPVSQATPVAPVAAAAAVPAPAPVAPAQSAAAVAAPAVRPQASVRQATREERLATALDSLMEESPDIQAAALVSMDGFTMASALPAGMQEDRVGAMSAAILGLGERAAAELGRGQLTQVFIEGDDGYVVLIAAGERAVLTTLANQGAKLGLVLYDMKVTAEAITEILG
jgi:predicted regulator of Ras-like GTPase activity (Roadblock/LC7/MglB family)